MKKDMCYYLELYMYFAYSTVVLLCIVENKAFQCIQKFFISFIVFSWYTWL